MFLGAHFRAGPSLTSVLLFRFLVGTHMMENFKAGAAPAKKLLVCCWFRQRFILPGAFNMSGADIDGFSRCPLRYWMLLVRFGKSFFFKGLTGLQTRGPI